MNPLARFAPQGYGAAISTHSISSGDEQLIESKADLLGVFEKGSKPKADWRIGTEHEKFVFRTADHRAPSYDEPGGIRDLLMAMTEFGCVWSTCLKGTKACSGVSIDEARGLRLYVQ